MSRPWLSYFRSATIRCSSLLGLLGGFATPALLSTGEDRPISLFGYLLLLNAGLAWVAYRKRWNLLTVLCLVFTTTYQWVWVGRFLVPDRLPLAAGIFLVFPILSFSALVLARSEPTKGKGWSARVEVVVAEGEETE